MSGFQENLPELVRSEDPVTIREVTTRADRKRFVRMVRPLYGNDPFWVAPLEIQTLEFLDPRKHPFLRHGTASCFLAERNGRVVGRILVSEDPHYQERYGRKTGHFGMFESIRDPAVSGALLDTAMRWHQRRGNTELLGPVNYSMNYPCGLLVDGFDSPPRLMMNHNPPWYAELLEQWGLKKE
ncbi:MAG: N-acetyltransferase, partial [Planctomycetia bacterium]|nr:N-acetyltransferase [Planctomycetia bacterium]